MIRKFSISRLNRWAFVAALALAPAACGKSSDDPLEPAPVAELRGPWLMFNRIADCDHQQTLFSPRGLFRVYQNKEPRRQYFEIVKFTLEPEKITLGVKGLAHVDADVGSLVFSLREGKLRLLDLLGPNGASFKSPPDSMKASDRAYLVNVYRINEMRFAMDRCPGA